MTEADTLNSLERYMAVVSGKPCDFLPRLPILMQYAAEHIGSYYGAFASDYRVLTDANIRCCEIPHGTPVENLKALCEPVDYAAKP